MNNLTQEYLAKEATGLVNTIIEKIKEPIIRLDPTLGEGLSKELDKHAMELASLAAMSLTLDLICEKLEITEEEGKEFLNKSSVEVYNKMNKEFEKLGL